MYYCFARSDVAIQMAGWQREWMEIGGMGETRGGGQKSQWDRNEWDVFKYHMQVFWCAKNNPFDNSVYNWGSHMRYQIGFINLPHLFAFFFHLFARFFFLSFWYVCKNYFPSFINLWYVFDGRISSVENVIRNPLRIRISC